VWVGWSARELNEFKKVVAEYDAKNPNVEVKVVGGINDDKIIAALRSGNGPDVVSSFTSSNVGLYCSSGGWVDLAPYLKQSNIDMNQFPESTRYYTQYQGKRCALPLLADVYGFYYNKDLFKKAGLDPNKPPTSLAEIRTYADKITALGGDTKGYYLPGNCAGCNIFTVGPLMWASGATIEAEKCGSEPLVGDGVKAVDQWARDMVAAKNVPDSAQAETGATFAEQFGSGKLGMMGTGNFNIVLARDQMKDHPFEFGISLLPGTEPGKYASFIGGDLVVIPNGSKRVDDAIAFMHYLLQDAQQVELYAKALNLTTRTDPKLSDNQYYKAEPLIQDVSKALAVGRTPYTLTFFEQINDPAGPWLQHLQRAYYTTDDLDQVITDAKNAMKAISCK
jgi:multiple sugar transport system substrate-binding protein